MGNPFTRNPIYACICLAACGYFCIAAVQGWQNPLNDPNQPPGSGFSSSSGHTYSWGTYGGRTSGGFGGGGK